LSLSINGELQVGTILGDCILYAFSFTCTFIGRLLTSFDISPN
jgi:hypothetical protein